MGSKVGSAPALPRTSYNLWVPTGELPFEIIRMQTKGIIPHANKYGKGCGLLGNNGFTLPSSVGELGDDITELNLAYCSLTGPLSTPV